MQQNAIASNRELPQSALFRGQVIKSGLAGHIAQGETGQGREEA